MRPGLLLIATVVSVSCTVVSAAPINGLYASMELGGTMIDGRWSEGWPGGGPLQVGNTVHAASWDGAVLGGQWELKGPALAAPPTVLINTLDINGNGLIVYLASYAGGTLMLDSSGPWGVPGDPDYTFNVDTYNHTTTYTYVQGVPVTYTIIANLRGTWADDPSKKITFLVAAAVPTGQSPSPMPADYPALLPPGTTTGAWGIIQKMRMEIVPEPATIALMMVLAGGGLLRRHCR